MYNIYREETGVYYYSESKRSRDDKLVERNVSVEYGFMFCAARNYHNTASVNINVTRKGRDRNYKILSEKQLKFIDRVNSRMHNLLTRQDGK